MRFFSLLVQQVYEPTADCISSSLIDLSDPISAHTDYRISPAVTYCSHLSKLQETWGQIENQPLLGGQGKSINSDKLHMIIRLAPCWILTQYEFTHMSDLQLHFLILTALHTEDSFFLCILCGKRLIFRYLKLNWQCFCYIFSVWSKYVLQFTD